jgi:hypothetical protein
MLIATQLRASHASAIKILENNKEEYRDEITRHTRAIGKLSHIISTLRNIADETFLKNFGIPHPITNANMTCFTILDLGVDNEYDYQLIVNGIVPKNMPKFVADLMYPTPTEEELHYLAHIAEQRAAAEMAKMAEQMNPNNPAIYPNGKLSNKKLKKLIKEQFGNS